MITFIKKVPWWGWIVIFIFILIMANQVSSYFYNRSLFNMALNNLRKDESSVVKDRDEWIKSCEKEIRRLADEKTEIEKKIVILEKKEIISATKIAKLTGENNELKDQLNRIIVSDDPDKLLEDLRSRGINIQRHRNH